MNNILIVDKTIGLQCYKWYRIHSIYSLKRWQDNLQRERWVTSPFKLSKRIIYNILPIDQAIKPRCVNFSMKTCVQCFPLWVLLSWIHYFYLNKDLCTLESQPPNQTFNIINGFLQIVIVGALFELLILCSISHARGPLP